MEITGFAAQNASNFDAKKHLALIADNHSDVFDSATISEGIDLVVAELDAQTDGPNWVDMVKASPYYITRQNV